MPIPVFSIAFALVTTSVLCVAQNIPANITVEVAGDPVFSDDIAVLRTFKTKFPRRASIRKNNVPSKLDKDVWFVCPTESAPFVRDLDIEFPEKNLMFPPRRTEAEMKRYEKEEKERKKLEKEEKEKAEKIPPKELTPEERAEFLKARKEAEIKKKEEAELFAKLRDYQRIPAREIVAHPVAKIFPGEVPKELPRAAKSYTTSNKTRGWQCTGLYAPAGELIKLHVATAGINTGYKIRIGSHPDNLLEGTMKNEWKRFPLIIRDFNVTADTMDIASPFGGMIYIEAPKPPKKRKIVTSSQARIPERVRFEFIGAVEAPIFIKGKTTASDWKYLRNAPAPWAEFVGDNLIATVPAYAVRSIENPEEIIAFWDDIIDGQDKLAGTYKDRDKNDDRKIERLVFDVDSNAFATHSGEIIVCSLPLLDSYLKLDKIKAGGAWEIFMALGMNRISNSWTFDKNRDVAAAIFALRSMEQATGKKPGTFFEVSALLSSALGEPDTAGTSEIIASYIPPMDEFGWEPLEKTLAFYDTPRKLRLETEEDRRRTFISLWSKFAQSNLSIYFAEVGFPDMSKQQNRFNALKVFAPKDFPPPSGLERTNPAGFLGFTPFENIEICNSDYDPRPKEEKDDEIEEIDTTDGIKNISDNEE